MEKNAKQAIYHSVPGDGTPRAPARGMTGVTRDA